MFKRYAEKYEQNATLHRILVKAYGLRFIIVVSGNGGKFNFIPLLTTIGAGTSFSNRSLILIFNILYRKHGSFLFVQVSVF